MNAAALQVAAGFAKRPAPDDVAAERDHIPRMNLLRPLRHLLGMLFHEVLDAVLISFDARAHLRADLVVFLAADLRVPPHSLDQIAAIRIRAEDFGHRAVRLAIVLQQLFEAVFGLRIADGERRRFERLRKTCGIPYSSR